MYDKKKKIHVCTCATEVMKRKIFQYSVEFLNFEFKFNFRQENVNADPAKFITDMPG